MFRHRSSLLPKGTDRKDKIWLKRGKLIGDYAHRESARSSVGGQNALSPIETNRLPVGASDYFLLADDPPDFQCAQPADSELTRARHPTLER